MRWSTRSFGKPNAPTRIAKRMTRFATLSNIRAKNAFASPARNQGLRGTVVALSKCARSYYAPIPPEDLVRYAAQLPTDFPCCAKAPEIVTSGAMPARVKGAPKGANPDFLNPRSFVDEMVGPFGELFREHTGPFLLQFP